MIRRVLTSLLLLVVATSCSELRPQAVPQPTGHLEEPAAAPAQNIPDIVQQVPFVPPPQAVPESERYTVVVNDVPVRELLFALARDAELNIDIAGDVDGRVTLNAIDQTLPQILERVARQVDLRYEIANGTVVISPDEPYYRTYDVGYVNLSRDTDTTVNVATRVATTGESSIEGSGGSGSGSSSGGGSGGGNNSSSTRLTSRSSNRFWETLENNILALLGETGRRSGGDISDRVIINAAAGMISVRATAQEHERIADFIDKVLVSARRQVMIEATIVEVTLNDQYQAGVDWTLFLEQGGTGFNFDQNLLGAVSDGVIDNAISSATLGYIDPSVGDNAVSASVRLLREFGDAKVLSSPRLMVLNNQTAILKVVEELVYFTVDVTNRDGGFNTQGRTIVESEVNSVPVGLVMAVTPQVSASDEVTLTVRPTISQKVGDAVDPGVQLAAQFNGANGANITNTVPIIRVREMESVLKLVDGQIGVLGGLMQDDIRTGNRQIPGLSKLPLLGDMLFNTEELTNTKTELVIFLRPVVVHDPNVETDLAGYREYLGSRNRPPRLGAQAGDTP
ncbi:MAG: secretin N-terminal domain-containing protein [Gammaproteobacteria bacterium]|nr:secretin N-terminal domain-containing protein [Gammaproteobacteria bacterium]MCP5200415.1 secretin N-terminal domain-containing protein [Gammaproteobacteria bacterium]